MPLLAQGEEAWLTLPAGPIQRIAFGSCAKHWQTQPIWDAIIEKKPDLSIFLGDNIYADTDGTTAWMVGINITPVVENVLASWFK